MEKIYRFTGVDIAVHLLRPDARWELSSENGGLHFSRWEDERPCPTIEEVKEVQKLMKEVEDKIPTVWTKAQIEKIQKQQGG
jgi:hypothetical protein